MALSQSKLQSPSPYYTATPVANATANSNAVSVPAAPTQKFTVYVTFTLGSLTNATITPQVSFDGTNWFNMTSPGALVMTATGKYAFVADCAGAKLFRVAVSSTGTTTSSVVAIDVGLQTYQVTN